MDSQNTEKFIPNHNWKHRISQINLNLILIIVILILTSIIIHIGSQRSLLFKEKIIVYKTSKDFSNSPSSISSSTKKFQIVLSYYNEDEFFVQRFIRYLRAVSTLKPLNPFVIVYNKNANINNTYLKRVLNADVVQSLPNIGREGATYLYHIIENYATLADHILFSQAGVEGITSTGLADWFSNRLEKQFNSSVGYMPLVTTNWMELYDCGLNRFNNMVRLAELWALIQQTICPTTKQAVAFRGQFLVSSKRIRIRPLRIYKYLNELLTADNAHWIHKDPRSPVGRSTSDNPFFGHVVERLWTTLFNCSQPDLIHRCNIAECACFD